jgi:predicted amino acid racemase
MLRVVDKEDTIYPGQYGGFNLSEIEALAGIMKNWSNISVGAVTSFPCFLFDPEKKAFTPTHNIETLKRAKTILESCGLKDIKMNMPSCTCCETIPLIAENNGAQCEPGHGFTGTTPYHAVYEGEEKPALVYLSEVSHHHKGNSYCFGGGHYFRGHMKSAMVSSNSGNTICPAVPFPEDNIDYYLEIEGKHDIGATVLMAFRTQIFVTRSHVAVVSGLKSGNAKLCGLFTSSGKEVGNTWANS